MSVQLPERFGHPWNTIEKGTAYNIAYTLFLFLKKDLDQLKNLPIPHVSTFVALHSYLQVYLEFLHVHINLLEFVFSSDSAFWTPVKDCLNGNK